MMEARVGRRWATALVAALLGSMSAEASPASREGMVRVRGAYANVEYGFRFSAFPGATIWRASAPTPNHGAVVELGPSRRIEVSAAFDAPEYGSTTVLLTARLPSSGDIHVRRRAATLGGRTAEEATYRDGTTFHTLVVRHEGGVDDGVNYTAELTTTAGSESLDKATLARLLGSFRFIPRQ